MRLLLLLALSRAMRAPRTCYRADLRADLPSQATLQLKQRVRGLLDTVPINLSQDAAMPESAARLEAAHGAGAEETTALRVALTPVRV